MNGGTDRAYDVTTIAVFCAPTGAEEAAALMRRAVAALLAVDGVDFFDNKNRLIFERGDGLAPEWAKRPVFLTDDSSDYALLLHHFWREGEPYHYLALSPDSDLARRELEGEWRLFTDHMERLLPALDPDLALGFAQLRSATADPVDYGRLCSDRSHRVLAPWTYLGGRSLDEKTRGLLAAQAGISARAVSDGLLVRVVAVPGRPPDPRFREMIEAQANLTYVDPLVGSI